MSASCPNSGHARTDHTDAERTLDEGLAKGCTIMHLSPLDPSKFRAQGAGSHSPMSSPVATKRRHCGWKNLSWMISNISPPVPVENLRSEILVLQSCPCRKLTL